MPTRTQNMKLGVFLVATAALFALVFATVAGFSFFAGRATYYVVAEEGVGGLDIGAPVTMRGVRIGTVAAIELDPEHLDRVSVELEVEDDTPVPNDAVAHIQMSGLTGTRVVDIADGDLRSGVLEPGSVIPLAPTVLDTMEDRAAELAERSVALLEQGQTLMANLVEISDSVGQNVDPERVDRIVGDVEEILTNLKTTSAELAGTVKTGESGIRSIVEDVHRTTTDLQTILERSDQMLQNNDQDLRAAIRSLRQAAKNFEALSRDLQRQPSRIIRSRAPEPRELP